MRRSERVLCDITDEIANEFNARAYPNLPRTLELHGDIWEVRFHSRFGFFPVDVVSCSRKEQIDRWDV